MDHESFSTLAQVAVALVGFAALLNFLSRDTALADAHSAARGELLLEESAVALLACLLPAALYRTGMAVDVIWMVGSAALAIYFASIVVRAVLLIRRTGWGVTPVHLAGTFTIISVSCIHQAMSVLGWPWPNGEYAYYLGIMVLVLLSVSTFMVQYKIENPGAWGNRR